MKLQEALGSMRKTLHQNNNKQRKKIRLLREPQSDSKISTVKKHCQLITLLIKGYKKSLLIPEKSLSTKVIYFN